MTIPLFRSLIPLFKPSLISPVLSKQTRPFASMAIRPTPNHLTNAAAAAAASNHQPRDPNTLSNYHAWRTSHTLADFTIDFAAKKLKGTVHLTLQRLSDDSKIILDTSHLHITSVHLDGSPVAFDLAPSRTEPYGTPLTITANSTVDAASKSAITVSIGVETTENCTALQWLTPAQTSNGKHPYMFSQCQAIHARSLFPCQDTPDVKSTYIFHLRSRLPVLASGLATGSKNFLPGKGDEPGSLLYTFHQAIPMPSYLFAIASGDLASAAIGPRSTVWTGPEELTASQWEFERDTEAFIKAAEGLVYAYAWTSYNILVLPPSFPYGGENCLHPSHYPTSAGTR